MIADASNREYEYQALTFVTAARCNVPLPGAAHGCTGEMNSDGHTRTQRGTPDIEHRHRCSDCKRFEWLPRAYPSIRYESVQKPQVTPYALQQKAT